MRRHLNEPLVRRNRRLGKALFGIGLGAVGVGFFLSLSRTEALNLVLLLALGGTLVSQVGIAWMNRWGRTPRLDQVLDEAMKGLDARYALFHYSLGAPHALMAPAGVFALVPRSDHGDIVFEEERWWARRAPRRGKGAAKRVPLDDLPRAAWRQVESLEKHLRRALPDTPLPPVQAIVVFTHPRANVSADAAPHPAVHVKKLKDLLRRLPKRNALPPEAVDRLFERFGNQGRSPAFCRRSTRR